jgi:ParB-like chromosome segregation protein Spo0J
MNDLRPRGVPIDELQSDPGNARRHDDRNVAAIARSLERFGQRRPLVVARGAGGALFVIAGNGTLEAARSLEWPSILITEVPGDWDADKARAYALAGKVATGTSSEDIVAKELSLQGVQRPLSVGFPPDGREVFRFGEFVGWVVESG